MGNRNKHGVKRYKKGETNRLASPFSCKRTTNDYLFGVDTMSYVNPLDCMP